MLDLDGWIELKGKPKGCLFQNVSEACEENKKVQDMISVSCRKRLLSFDGAQKRKFIGDRRRMKPRENDWEEVTFRLRLEGQVEVCDSAK